MDIVVAVVQLASQLVEVISVVAAAVIAGTRVAKRKSRENDSPEGGE
jgi:hypothetical protein